MILVQDVFVRAYRVYAAALLRPKRGRCAAACAAIERHDPSFGRRSERLCAWSCRLVRSALLVTLGMASVRAQVPDHPIITEVYTDPIGVNDGPVARDPGSEHQEYVEIFLPSAPDLAPGLNKDALRLAFYEVEGDGSSSGAELVNYRFDLPTFDLDPANGITSGAVPRPVSGVVVMGWVDYVGNPPVDLAATPSTRIGLINGGITSSGPDFVFIAINGHHFSGTTNFPTLTAESLIHVPSETSSGVVQNGSAAYLLVDRDGAGYVELYDDNDDAHVPPITNADPSLDTGTVLGTDSLLDAFAANDDGNFNIDEQPLPVCADPPDQCVDLQTVLPDGGAFSLLTPQIPEKDTTRITPATGNGYARRFVDVAKTSEDAGSPDDPAADASNAYQIIRNNGPFFPTPGRAAQTSSPPELAVAAAVEQVFSVLAGTTGHPGLLTANVGGDYGIDISVSGGPSSDPAVGTFAPGSEAGNVGGQSFAFPSIAITPGLTALHGESASAMVTVTASNSLAGDPTVVAGTQSVSVTATVLDPIEGLSANGQPLQATVFAAVIPVLTDPMVANEFLGTSVGAFLDSQPDIAALETVGNGTMLLDPASDMSSPLLITGRIIEMPDTGEECTNWLNPPGPAGRLDFAGTVVNSAEVQSGATTYDNSIAANINCGIIETRVRARDFNHPDVQVFGGSVSASELLQFANAAGTVGNPRSGLSNATTSRTFELLLVDTNLNVFTGSLETGLTDDFGLVVEVLETEPGSPVVPGEFVFLSFTGGLQGADLDLLVGEAGNVLLQLILLDLDNLHSVLGIRSIERTFVVDGSGTGEIDLLEVFALNPVSTCGFDTDCDDGNPCTDDFCNTGTCDHVPNSDPCNDGDACTLNDVCTEGVCLGGSVIDCDDGIACTSDSCSNGSCAHAPNHAFCDDGLFCTGIESCSVVSGCSSSGNPCSDPVNCDESLESCGCEAPQVAGAGPRYVNITPTSGNAPVAIYVTGVSASVVCVAGYVREDHTLGPIPVYKPSSGPGGWNVVHLRGAGIEPSAEFAVQLDCNSGNPGTQLSPTASARTWRWGDVDNSTLVDILDAVRILDGFRNRYHSIPCTTNADCANVRPHFRCDQNAHACVWITLENVDLRSDAGCIPERVISILDVLSALDAFRGFPSPCITSCP